MKLQLQKINSPLQRVDFGENMLLRALHDNIHRRVCQAGNTRACLNLSDIKITFELT